jgi:hypothetical protein
MFTVIIKSENTRTVKTNGGNELRQQQAAMDQGHDYPAPFWLIVDQPYSPGRYTLDPNSFRVNQFGGLELDRYNIRLEAMPK